MKSIAEIRLPIADCKKVLEMDMAEATAAKLVLQSAKGMLMELADMARPGKERTLVDQASRAVSQGISFFRDANRYGDQAMVQGMKPAVVPGAKPNMRCISCRHEFYSTAKANATCPECKKKVYIGHKSRILRASGLACQTRIGGER